MIKLFFFFGIQFFFFTAITIFTWMIGIYRENDKHRWMGGGNEEQKKKSAFFDDHWSQVFFFFFIIGKHT